MRDASPIIGPVTIKNDFNKCMSFFNEEFYCCWTFHSRNPPPPFKGAGEVGTFKNWVIWRGGGVPKSLLEREDNSEKGVFRTYPPFFYYFTVQLHLLWVGKSKVCFVLFYYTLILQFFELTIPDSHTRLHSTKTLYHLCISNSFW